MIKYIRFAAVAASLGLTANAFGAANETTTIEGTTVISNINNCTALSNDVTVQLSADVIAVYKCTSSSVNAGTCHQNGTNKSQDFKCTYTAVQQEDGSTTYATPAGCTAWDGTGTQPSGTYTNSGRVGFSGGSGGGSVTPFGLGSTSCDTTTVKVLVGG